VILTNLDSRPVVCSFSAVSRLLFSLYQFW